MLSLCDLAETQKEKVIVSTEIEALVESLFLEGTNEDTKTDVFSEKFQMAFDPPPRFRKIILQIFRQKCVCSLWRECYNINVLYDPISHEMHVVQQFNMVIG